MNDVCEILAVILLGCCLNPLESSLMPACKRVVMNSGNVQMTALPQMRSGKEEDLCSSQCIHSVFCPSGGVLIFEPFDLSRRSVIETSRSLKELFHEARERASKALGFAKMLRKVRDGSEESSLP